MADKQLTVAELLARAEKENPSGARARVAAAASRTAAFPSPS